MLNYPTLIRRLWLHCNYNCHCMFYIVRVLHTFFQGCTSVHYTFCRSVLFSVLLCWWFNKLKYINYLYFILSKFTDLISFSNISFKGRLMTIFRLSVCPPISLGILIWYKLIIKARSYRNVMGVRDREYNFWAELN